MLDPDRLAGGVPHLQRGLRPWLLFKLPHFADVVDYVRCLAHNPGGLRPQEVFLALVFAAPVVLQHAWAAFPERVARLRTKAGPTLAAWSEAGFYGVLALLIVLNSGPAGEFIYFQF